MRGLFCDNYSGFKKAPPPTGNKGFPLGTLTFSEEKASLLSCSDVASKPTPRRNRPPAYLITLMLLKAEVTGNEQTGERALYILKNTYDAVFPDYPFQDDVSARCVADTLIAVTLESPSCVQEKIGIALSRALTCTPWPMSCDVIARH